MYHRFDRFLEKETRYPDTKSEIIENDLKS